jgi:hypothetical protein
MRRPEISPFQAFCLSLGFFTLQTGLSGFPVRSPARRWRRGVYWGPPLLDADLPCGLIRLEKIPGDFRSFLGVLKRPSLVDRGRSPFVFWEKAGSENIRQSVIRKAQRMATHLKLLIFPDEPFKKFL